jgi:hypothetical protein
MGGLAVSFFLQQTPLAATFNEHIQPTWAYGSLVVYFNCRYLFALQHAHHLMRRSEARIWLESAANGSRDKLKPVTFSPVDSVACAASQ